MEAVPKSRGKFLLIVFVAALGLATAFYRLGSRGLWGDEVWQISWARQQSLPETFVRFTIFGDTHRALKENNLRSLVVSLDNQPLHFLLTNLSTQVRSTEFWIRFPSAILGAAAVLMMFLLASNLFDWGVGLVAAVLLAFAPYHVWYAQDARAYSALIFYSLLSLYFFFEILERPSPKSWFGLTLATTLNLYNHLLALGPFIIVSLMAAGLTIAWWLRGRLAMVDSDVAALRSRRRSVWAVWSSLLLSAIIALPVIAKTPIFLRFGGLVPGQNVRFHLTRRFLESLFGVFGGGEGVYFWVFAILSIIGLGAAVARRFRFGTLTLIWILLPLIALGIFQPRRFVPMRYLLFIQPLFLLMVALGSLQVIRLLGRVKDIVLPGMPFRNRAISWLPVGFVLGMIGLTIFPLTWKVYWTEKGNDWSGICSYLHRWVRPGDAVIGDDYAFSVMDQWGYAMRNGVALIRSDGHVFDKPQDFGRNVWYIALDARRQQRQGVSLQADFERIPKAAYSKSGLMSFKDRFGGRLAPPTYERSATLYRLYAKLVPSSIELKDNPPRGNWPACAHIKPGDHYDVFLRLPASASRVLSVTTWLDMERTLILTINGRPIGTVMAGKQGRGWRTFRFPLSASDADSFLLKMENLGSATSFVRRVEVSYGLYTD
jgi:4-amino-4-deoxy-L-arabinose transferase-like glycosyltransferase